jgi:hypothetical protein
VLSPAGVYRFCLLIIPVSEDDMQQCAKHANGHETCMLLARLSTANTAFFLQVSSITGVVFF